MLSALSGGERTVGALAAPFALSLAAASKHIRTLEHAGLVGREVRGRTHLLRLSPRPLADAHAWLGFYERFWSERLDILEGLLREDAATAAVPAPPAPASPAPARPDPPPLAPTGAVDPDDHSAPEGDDR